MNRLNAKRIGVLAASLLFGLAVAGPVSFSSIPIINSAGQPVVQIVVGSTAQPSDGVVAANIAAVIGNLAFTSTPITATVGGTSGLKCVVTTATCAISNQQVYLGESGVAAPSGTFGFTALIGSVLNAGITSGSPASTKGLQTGTQYAYQRGSSPAINTAASPPQSPYSAAGYVPSSPSPLASTTGGGVTFSTFTVGTSPLYDNLVQVTNAQLPALLSNYGNYGETESLWLTGFPVYDQQTNPLVQSFAILGVGGAYQIVFNKPIHEPYYVGTTTLGGTSYNVHNTNSINNAQITLLGQNWTIVNYGLPGTALSSTTTAENGGKLSLASSLVPLSTVYVGKNVSSGPFTVQLADLGTANTNGYSPAAINVYYKGVLTNSSSIWPADCSCNPPSTFKYNITGTLLYVKVNETFAGLYAYQKWAKIQLYSGVYNVTDGGVFNQTRDPGWNINLLWVNTSGSGQPTDLQSIVLYNTSATSLLPGQSFTFIQNPKAYKVTFVGDTLGNNFDSLTASSVYASGVSYQNVPINALALTSFTPKVDNVTEPAQELVVTSQIPNAFSFGGQTSSSVTYLLTPYTLTEVATQTTPAKVTLTLTAATNFQSLSYVNTANPLTLTITGYSSTASTQTQTEQLSFTTGTTAVSSYNYFLVTGIKLTRAIPGLILTVTGAGAVSPSNANNVMAVLQPATVPYAIYTPAGGNSDYTYTYTDGSSVTYNQQNGQGTVSFTLTPTSGGPALKTNTHLYSYFTYNMPEINVASNTVSQDEFAFGIVNSTAGVAQTPLFQLNYSTVGLGTTQNNVTYIASQGNPVLAKKGFISERGSQVSQITPTTLTFNLAEHVDTLQLVVGAMNVTPSGGKKVVGPYGIGQSITGLPNVTIANVTATCTVTGGVSGCTVSGLSNLTATASVTNATTPVVLNTATTPLAVLDSNANQASTLVVIGSKFVNSVAAQIFSQNPSLDSSFNAGSVVLQAFGSNRILVAGYYANQTVQAGNQFIQALLSQA